MRILCEHTKADGVSKLHVMFPNNVFCFESQLNVFNVTHLFLNDFVSNVCFQTTYYRIFGRLEKGDKTTGSVTRRPSQCSYLCQFAVYIQSHQVPEKQLMNHLFFES